MASQNVLAELANRINTKDEMENDNQTSPSGTPVVNESSKNKEPNKVTSGEKGKGGKFKRTKSQDGEKSPNHGKKKDKAKVQKVDSDANGETQQKKKGFLANLRRVFKRKQSDKHRKLSSDKNKLRSKSRSENDLITTDSGKGGFRSDGDSSQSWASGLDGEDLDSDKKGRKSGFGSFIDKRIRDSFRNPFKLKSRKGSGDKSAAESRSKQLGYPSQRPMSDSNLYNITRDADFFDDSFFTVSLINDNESFTSQPESVTIGDFTTLETSPSPTGNNVARSKIQIAPKNRRRPARFKGSKSMSDTTDNMASLSSLGMISEVTSDDDRKFSPDFEKEIGKVVSEGSLNGHVDRASVEAEIPSIRTISSASSSLQNDADKASNEIKPQMDRRSSSLILEPNDPASELSHVLTTSLSSLDKFKVASQVSRSKLGSRTSVEKMGSKPSLHEFEIKRLSLRSTSNEHLGNQSEDEAKFLNDIPTKSNIERVDQDISNGRTHLVEKSEEVEISSQSSVTMSSPKRLDFDKEEVDLFASVSSFDQSDSKDKLKKDSRIPVQSKTQLSKFINDSSTLLSNDVKDGSVINGSVGDEDAKLVLNGTISLESVVKDTSLQSNDVNIESRSHSVVRLDPSLKIKGSALPVLDRSRLNQSVVTTQDSPGDPRSRTKSASSLTSQSCRFGNKALSLDDDFRSNDDKSSINRSKSLSSDSKRLRFTNKALSERHTPEALKNGSVVEEDKPNWVAIAKEKQKKRDSMEHTESSGEEREVSQLSPIIKRLLPADKKPEIPKKPKSLKMPTPLGDNSSSNKDFVRTTRSLKIQSGASPVIEMDMRGDSAASAANCVVCGKVSYMFGRFELNGQYFHKCCAKCVICGQLVTSDSIILKDKVIFCQLHSESV